MKKMRKISSILAVLFMMVFSLFNVKPTIINAAGGKELTDVVTDVKIWFNAHNNYAPKVGDTYQIEQGSTYQLELFYDLTKYDHNQHGGLQDGDYFNIKIPAPLTVKNGSAELTDPQTGIKIADLAITTSGPKNGGNVKVTLKNLETYKNTLQSNTIFGVKGKLYANFLSSELDTEDKELIFGNTKDRVPFKLKYKTIPVPIQNYAERIGKENFAKVGNVYKEEWASPLLQKEGSYLHRWTLRINARRQQYGALRIVDSIAENGGPAQFVPETLEVYRGQFRASDFELRHKDDMNQPGELLQPNVDYELIYDGTYTKFELKILTPGDYSYVVRYGTTGTFDGGKVGNKLRAYGDGDVPITYMTDSTSIEVTEYRISKITYGGTIQIDTSYRVIVYKVDKDTFRKLPGAVFELEKPDGTKVQLPATDQNGMTLSEQFSPALVAMGPFKLREITPPPGYQPTNTVETFTIPADGVIRTIKNEKIKINVDVEKIWSGPRKDFVEVRIFNVLTPTKTIETKKITKDMGWKYTFEGLPKFNDDGTLAKYKIEETAIENYDTQINGDQDSGFRISNTNVEVIKVPVQKTWVGPEKDEVEVAIYNKLNPNNPLKKQKLTKATGWKTEFTNLLKYNPNGSLAEYIIKETPIANYRTEISGDQTNYTIKNINTEVIRVKVNKEWIGPKGQSVEVKIFNEKTPDQIIETKTITEAMQWEYTFMNLPKYNADGTEAKYKVAETPIPNYTSVVEGDQTAGFKIKNTNTEKIQVKVNKIWHGLKQDKVEVKLFNEKDQVNPIETKEITKDMGWEYTFINLPKYNADGTLAKYVVKETPIPNYDQSLLGDQNVGFTFINTNTEKVNVPVRKTWVGPVGTQVEVKLYEEDDQVVPVRTQVITAATNWEYTFMNLPKYTPNGKLAKYIVKETPIANYETTIEGNNDLFVITNRNTETINIPVEKRWVGPKQDSVEVKLYHEDDEVNPVQVAVISAATDWKHVFENLPKYNQDGSEAQYIVVETPIANYETKVEGDQSGYIITNTNTEKIAVEVVKRWIGKALEKVEVELYQNGNLIQTFEVKESEGYKARIANLPKYDAEGKAYVYEVKEKEVAGYVSEVNKVSETSFIITNTEKPTKPKPPVDSGDTTTGLMGMAVVAFLGLVFLKKQRKH